MDFSLEEYYETDPRAKDEEWCEKHVRHFRQYMKPLVDPIWARENMKWLLSNQDMKEVMDMFMKPEEVDKKFAPLAIMEKVRNLLGAERSEAGVSINIKANDASAIKEKDRDYKLLKNRSKIEKDLSPLYASIGLPPYKLANEKENGKRIFNSNVEEFDEMGLDDTQTAHVDYFYRTYFKLLHEIAGQSVINFLIDYNKLPENLEFWSNDIMAKKAIAMRCYVSEMTGAQELKYLAPENLDLIPGNDKDGKDAPAIGYRESGTVGQFLRLAGSDFVWDRDLQHIIDAVNIAYGSKYTGVWDSTGKACSWGKSTGADTVCSASYLMHLNVSWGYMEWKSWDATARKTGTDYHGNIRSIPVQPKIKLEPNTGYESKVYYNEVTYKALYLIKGLSDEKIIRFGKLYFQPVEGVDDEFSGYSILFRKQEGKTIAEIAEPWLKSANEMFYKMRWMAKKAKPNGRGYLYESVAALAKKMIGSGSNAADVNEVLKTFSVSLDELYTIPSIGGQPVGGGVNPNYEIKRGLDPSVMTFSQLIDWAANKIDDAIGINALREGYTPDPKDGYKLGIQALQNSRKATAYMGTMIDSVLKSAGEYMVNAAQNIVQFKNTLAYKFLETAVGSEALGVLADTKFAMHRYGVFVDTYNNAVEKQKLEQVVNDAWVKGEISFESRELILGMDNPKKAGMILSFEKWRNQQEKLKEAQMANAQMVDMEKLKHANTMEEIDLKGKYSNNDEKIKGDALIEVAKIGAGAKLQANKDREENEPTKQEIRTQAKIQEHIAKSNIEQQQPV